MKRFLALAVLAVPLVQASEVQACSFDPCSSPVRLFPSPENIPANLIRFKVITENPGPLELRASDGTLVPASIRTIGPDQVFTPDTPPPAGQTLSLKYQALCQVRRPEAAPPQPEPKTFQFQVGPAREVDLQPSSLTAGETGVRNRGGEEAIVARYVYGSPDRSGSLAHLINVEWTIDGQPFSPLEDQVYSTCNPRQRQPLKDSCNNINTVDPGRHVVQARASIVGEQEFTSELTVDTGCEQIARLPDDKSVRPLTGGCDLGGGRGLSGLPLLPLLLAALAWLGRHGRTGSPGGRKRAGPGDAAPAGMKKHLLFAALAPLLAAVPVRSARACSFVDCQAPVRLFQPDRHVPANLVWFRVDVHDPGPLQLRSADGSAVPASIRVIGRDRVFAPDTPPATDQRLTLHYRPVCQVPSPVGAPPNPTERTFSFNVVAAGEMRLESSELVMTEKGIAYHGTARDMVVRYAHSLPDRSANAWHLADTTWTIAGRPYATHWNRDAVISFCTPPVQEWWPDSCGTLGPVPPGKHLLKAVTRIVGVDREFVADLEVDTSCDQVLRIDPREGPDGGPPDAGEDAGRFDAASDHSTTGPTPADGPGTDVKLVMNEGNDTRACTVAALGGAGQRNGGAASIGLLVAALAWLRFRRRQGTGL